MLFKNLVVNQLSRISFKFSKFKLFKLKAKTFASFHFLAPAAVSESLHSAALIPLNLFAAILAPVPVPHKTIASSALFSNTNLTAFIVVWVQSKFSLSFGP